MNLWLRIGLKEHQITLGLQQNFPKIITHDKQLVDVEDDSRFIPN